MADNERQLKWEAIAAPLDPAAIKFREQAGETIPYIDARDVIERLNSVVPGEWEYRWELVNISANGDWTIKAALTVMGVTHEDVGVAEGKCWGGPEKASVSDGLKRCAVQFGFAIELYQDDISVLLKKSTHPSSHKARGGRQAAPASRSNSNGSRRPSSVQNSGKRLDNAWNWTDFWNYANELGLSANDVAQALGMPSKEAPHHMTYRESIQKIEAAAQLPL